MVMLTGIMTGIISAVGLLGFGFILAIMFGACNVQRTPNEMHATQRQRNTENAGRTQQNDI